MNNGTDILNKLTEHLGVSVNELSSKCNYKRAQAFYDLQGGKTKRISATMANAIVGAYPQINIDYLLTGKGEMLKDSLPATSSTDEEDYMLVPLYNFDARGGFVGNDIVDAVEYIERRVPFIEARTTDICVPVSGDSMIPVYPPGSIVLLREVEGWREYFGFGNNFMLRLTDGRRILKRVQKSSEDSRNNVLCVSYNDSVDDEELPKSMIKQVFKVIRTLTDEGY